MQDRPGLGMGKEEKGGRRLFNLTAGLVFGGALAIKFPPAFLPTTFGIFENYGVILILIVLRKY